MFILHFTITLNYDKLLIINNNYYKGGVYELC